MLPSRVVKNAEFTIKRAQTAAPVFFSHFSLVLISCSYSSLQVDVFKGEFEAAEDAAKKSWIAFFCSLWTSIGTLIA